MEPERPLSLDLDHPSESSSLVREIWFFLRASGKWWLVPVLIALLLLGAVALLSTSVYAPLIYTLF